MLVPLPVGTSVIAREEVEFQYGARRDVQSFLGDVSGSLEFTTVLRLTVFVPGLRNKLCLAAGEVLHLA